jgi:hypothetical protein
MGVDYRGGPVIDPTANVIATLAAAVERLDDLREQQDEHLREIRNAEFNHVRELMNLRAEHEQELRAAEAKRIDAIRTVDVQAVSAAAAVSATQATTLAAQVATSAEALRNQVQAAAAAQTVALGAALDPIQKDVGDLRRVQYEQAGQRAGVTETKTDSRALIAIALTVIGSIIAIGGLILVAVKL